MKLTLKLTLMTMALAVWAPTAQAKYMETMDRKGLTKNLGSDYGLVDDTAKNNQSEVFQKAIDELAAAGGGRLMGSKGTYRFAGIRLKSNVHLLIEKDNFTTYCGITLTPTSSRTKDLSGWKVTCSTDGTVRNCRIFNASPGYGLTQLHGVFGKKAQIKTHAMMFIPEEYYDDLNLRWFNKFFEGPSIGGVKDSTGGRYQIKIENITMEGFKHNADKPILTAEDARPGKWAHALKEWKADRGIKDGK